jgi:hypothetical protein
MRIRSILSALALVCVASSARAQQSPCGRMHFRVSRLANGSARLVAVQGDSVRVVPLDSLSRSVRVGNLVRRCGMPVIGGRVVTWCIDHKASGIR